MASSLKKRISRLARRPSSALTWALLAGIAMNCSAATEVTSRGTDFFENKIRPIFAQHCYECHSAAKGPVKGGLELDWKGGWEKGGDSGSAIVPGDPEKSLLIKAIRYTDPDLQMPPKGKKLSAIQLNDLTVWVRMGAPDPRNNRPEAGTPNRVSGKQHWAFQPIGSPAPPPVRNQTWVKNDVDRFILAKLEANGIQPNPLADKRTLLRRVFYDLTGLPPSSEQVKAFLEDDSPDAFEQVVDRLLASPQYGERWARHWLDVARYSDSKGQPNRRLESSIFPYAWTYRDYVINAFNDDKPYDRFIVEQLAADRVSSGTNRTAMAALGFLTLGERYNGNTHEIINDRIDVTSKAFLGLTVACARCHDHKFDPIPQADYYSLHGIFASSVEPLVKPELTSTATTNPNYRDYVSWRNQIDTRLQEFRTQNVLKAFGEYQRLGSVYLYATRMPADKREAYVLSMGGTTNVLPAWQQLARLRSRQANSVFGLWNALARIPEARFTGHAPKVIANLSKQNRAMELHPYVIQAFNTKPPRTLAEAAVLYGAILANNEPAWQTLVTGLLGDAALRSLPARDRNRYFALREQSDTLEMVHPGAPPRAHVLADSPTPKDSPIFIRGEAENRGPIVPRRFLEALSGTNRPVIKEGSGRLELAQAIASRVNPLTARVMVNRVWLHHFGEGIVRTPDDFGVQSDPPSHPELLDYLASRFMTEGWSLKKLHKLILLAATYQQSSKVNPTAAEKDPLNRWLARANVRKLEFEPLRDSILFYAGKLDLTLNGHPVDLSQGKRPSRSPMGGMMGGMMNRIPDFRMAAGTRRTIYGYVDRRDLLEEFNIFDVPNPSASVGKRYESIAPQQALFLMNSSLMLEQIRRIVQRSEFQAESSDSDRVNYLYQLFFQRLPNKTESEIGLHYLRTHREAIAKGAPVRSKGLRDWEEYAHALLLTNEAAFVD